MTTEKQTEALQLADQLQEMSYGTCHNAAIELRRLAPFEAWYEESVDEINRLRGQVEALTRDTKRQASKITELAAELVDREARHRVDKARLQAIHAHQEGECWYWQGDGQDHLDSLVGSLPVVIRADQLRELLAEARDPALAPTRPAVPWWLQRADEIELDVARGAMSAPACYTQMRQLLQANDAPTRPAVPEGWPTNEMIEAGRRAANTHGPLLGNGQSLWHVFRDMLAAAPQADMMAIANALADEHAKRSPLDRAAQKGGA